MKQLTKEQAIAIYEGGEWKDWTDEELVRFQLFQDCLAVPFSRFHEAIEKVLDRPVWTHEFAYRDSLIDEYQKEHPAPTFEEIISLIPKDKLITIGL
jgi:hypothetical protein